MNKKQWNLKAHSSGHKCRALNAIMIIWRTPWCEVVHWPGVKYPSWWGRSGSREHHMRQLKLMLSSKASIKWWSKVKRKMYRGCMIQLSLSFEFDQYHWIVASTTSFPLARSLKVEEITCFKIQSSCPGSWIYTPHNEMHLQLDVMVVYLLSSEIEIGQRITRSRHFARLNHHWDSDGCLCTCAAVARWYGCCSKRRWC